MSTVGIPIGPTPSQKVAAVAALLCDKNATLDNVDFAERRVFGVRLQPALFSLAVLFLLYPGETTTYYMVDRLWELSSRHRDVENCVKVQVCKLRRIMRTNNKSMTIFNTRGLGYEYQPKIVIPKKKDPQQ